MMRNLMATAVLATCAAPAAANDLSTRLMASTCYGCHGPNGRSDAAIPGLAGQEKAYLLEAMLEQKSGARESTVMGKFMQGYTKDEIGKMAEFFSKLPK